MDDLPQQQWNAPPASQAPEEDTGQQSPRAQPTEASHYLDGSGFQGPRYPGYPAPPQAAPPGAPGSIPGYYGPPSMPMPGYPGGPSTPFYPGAPPSGSFAPGWGGSFPPSYSAYPGIPSQAFPPSMTLPGLQPPSRQRSPLARRFPFWLSLLLTVGTIVAAALVYVGNEVVLHGDWSSGARAAGIAALALAGATLLLLVVRLSMGRRGISTILLSLLLALVLAAGGAGGLAYANPLHGIQAQKLEQSGDWSGAIYEYELGGENAPNAVDVARVYDEWGEQTLQQKDYKSAAARFVMVITQYGQSGAPVDRAQTDLFNT
ncbi:MAG: hypothetical protein ACRDHP_14115, partial [Ktedonobacterales bacterium]